MLYEHNILITYSILDTLITCIPFVSYSIRLNSIFTFTSKLTNSNEDQNSTMHFPMATAKKTRYKYKVTTNTVKMKH